jgi:hypothetical protein
MDIAQRIDAVYSTIYRQVRRPIGENLKFPKSSVFYGVEVFNTVSILYACPIVRRPCYHD